MCFPFGFLGGYLYGKYLWREVDHTGFLYFLISGGQYLGAIIAIILCSFLLVLVSVVLKWIYHRMTHLIALAIPRVARVTDKTWGLVEKYFRWIVSSDSVSQAIHMKELDVLDHWAEHKSFEGRWIERKASASEKSGDLALAIEEWDIVLEIVPNDWWPLYQKARLYEKLGDFERAIKLWEGLVLGEDQSCHSLAIARLERAYTIGRGPEGAIEAWKDLILANPSKTSLLNSAAQILRAQAAYTISIDTFSKLSEMDAENRQAKMLLARAYEAKRDYERALALRRKIWDQFKGERAETTLALSYIIFLNIGERCEGCREARRELDPWYNCEKCDQYIGGLTNVKVCVRDELLKRNAGSSWAVLRTYFEEMMSLDISIA
jgi:tetratricopeptide (TPR) repeat protein